MPTKLKPSQKTRKRGETRDTVTHYYIKNISQKELFEALNNHNTPPRRKGKIHNELARRGVTITHKVIDSE